MFGRTFRLTRIRGVDVRLDPSLILLAALFAWVFASRFTAVHSPLLAWSMAALGVVGLLASILAHELAHAFEALHRGIEVEGITLLMFGGVTEMHASGESPRDEFVIAAVGPYVSLVCGAVFGLGATFAPTLPGPVGQPLAEVAGLLGWLNVFLALFNIVPGAPLDGGRVLRAAVWWITRSRRRGTRVAARAGQLLAAALLAFGVWSLQPPTDVAGFLIGVFLGFFLWNAARSELRQSDIDLVLDESSVADLVDPLPATVAADRPLELLEPHRLDEASELLLVADADEPVGVVRADDIRRLHPSDRALRTAGDLMEPIDELPLVDLDAGARSLVAAFHGARRAVRVGRDGRTLGVVTEREVSRAVHARRANGGRRARDERGGGGQVGAGARDGSPG